MGHKTIDHILFIQMTTSNIFDTMIRMKTYQTLYVSKATENIDSKSVNKFLEKAIAYNTKNNITGILLFRAGIFLQLLEGDKQLVEDLLEKIEKDNRHSNITRIFSLEKNERLFPNWSMGYHEISDLDINMINEFLSWNKLISAAKDLDNNIILHMLARFETLLIKK